MRIGIGTRIGGVSVFASKNARPGNATWGCLVWFLRLAFLPFWLLYLYIRWCIKNNSECDDVPIYMRPWAITTVALAVLMVAAGIWAALNPEEQTGPAESAAQAAFVTPQQSAPEFCPVDGYDMAQSLFLSLEDTGSTYAGFIANVEGSELEYLDRFISGGQCIEVWTDRDGQEYTNKLEVTFYNAGEDDEYIRTAEYWGDDSAVRISLHNEFESYEDGGSVLCIIDANEKIGATFKTTDYATIADAMNAIIGK